MARKKNMKAFLNQAIGDSAKLAKKYTAEGISKRLRIEQIRILNASFRGYDVDYGERLQEKLTMSEMTDLYEDYIAKGGVIRTVKERKKNGQKKACRVVKSSFKEERDTDGTFVWQDNK